MKLRRTKGGWIDWLTESEKRELKELRKLADDMDRNRRIITMEMDLIRQRAHMRSQRIDMPRKRGAVQ